MKRIILALSAVALLSLVVGSAFADDDLKSGQGTQKFWENKAGYSGQGG